MRLKNLQPTWDLEPLFPGGSGSEAFKRFLEQLSADLKKFDVRTADLKVPTGADQAKGLADVLTEAQNVSARLHESSAFVSCLVAQNVNDRRAVRLRGTLREMNAALATTLTTLDSKLAEIDDSVWELLLEKDGFREVAFALREKRRRAVEKLSPETEALINDLKVDGYEAWSGLYDLVVGKMNIEVDSDGKKETLSISQLDNRLADSDREVRKQMFRKYTNAWEEAADLCAEALNHISGFRLNLYKHRGWHSVLQEPLDINRMKAETLDAMWSAIDKQKDKYVAFFDRKAKLLGIDRLSWYDVNAPIASAQETVSYDEAAQFIVRHFERFSPDMAAFAEKALADRWIEAEDRSGKRPGGFCTSFPVSGQTRVFMTFSGTKGNVATLAHELGHAYHQHVMKRLPYWSQRYAMNVAETASTFAEAIVGDASVKTAESKTEKLALLEEKVRRGVTFFTNLRARFLFETRFYEERKQGLVPVERLNELMVEAQREAFGNALGEYHPTFWASKLHFYITGTPFYNFPYTFGFLFSNGIYARSLQEETASFAEQYVHLLKDTGSMTVEDLAAKHLQVDLTNDDFWDGAVRSVLNDIDEFLRLTDHE
ncbi:MAG TPA: M3 family oligoendopeptidase [Bacillales bacterium]|nr:M3 family oligoendopeptidase [Bacillales bacterium]